MSLSERRKNWADEAVRQLRGECGERQVREAKTAVVNGNGGNSASSQSTSVLATADAL